MASLRAGARASYNAMLIGWAVGTHQPGKPLPTAPGQVRRGWMHEAYQEVIDMLPASNPFREALARFQGNVSQAAESLGLSGTETFTVTGVETLNDGPTPRTVKVTADGTEFDAVVRIDTPGEADYYRHGGIPQYVLRKMLES